MDWILSTGLRLIWAAFCAPGSRWRHWTSGGLVLFGGVTPERDARERAMREERERQRRAADQLAKRWPMSSESTSAAFRVEMDGSEWLGIYTMGPEPIASIIFDHYDGGIITTDGLLDWLADVCTGQLPASWQLFTASRVEVPHGLDEDVLLQIRAGSPREWVEIPLPRRELALCFLNPMQELAIRHWSVNTTRDPSPPAAVPAPTRLLELREQLDASS